MTEDKADFLRLAGDSDFQSRADSIFGSLNVLEPQQKDDAIVDSTVRGRAPRRVPDHVLHPEKWTKYSLEDDGSKTGSSLDGDALNKHVALSFLEEVRKTKAKESDQNTATLATDVEMAERHVFAKSAVKHKMEVEIGLPSSMFVEGINVMPEYVVGCQSSVKVSKKARQQQSDTSNKHASTVSLAHLEDQDTTEGSPENSKTDLVSGGEQLDELKFAKRKLKSRVGIRGRKSSEGDE